MFKYDKELLKKLYGENTFNREYSNLTNMFRKPIKSYKSLVKKMDQDFHTNPAYTTVYDYSHSNPIGIQKGKYDYNSNAIIDRIFLDFDKDLLEFQEETLKELPSQDKQSFMKEIIEQYHAQPPVEEAKKVKGLLDKHFPYSSNLLVFSGSKGCHLYSFFKPVQLEYPKYCIERFIKLLTYNLHLHYLDGNVTGDTARLSRIPTSYNPKSDLGVVPFHSNDLYDTIFDTAMTNECVVNPEELCFSDDSVSKKLKMYDEEYSVYLKYTQRMEEAKIKRYGEISSHKGNHFNKGKVQVNRPEDILLLNNYPCFQHYEYNHQTRINLVKLCSWLGLNVKETNKASKIFWQDKGVYNPKKHLHTKGQIRNIEKNQYLMTCSSNERCKCCMGKCKNKDRFMYKLNFIDEYYDKLNEYKK